MMTKLTLSQFSSLLFRACHDLRGTPRNTVDWTEPDQWIPELLKDADRELAETIWTGSGKTVNPRCPYGGWLLVHRYETSNGRSRVSRRSPP